MALEPPNSVTDQGQLTPVVSLSHTTIRTLTAIAAKT